MADVRDIAENFADKVKELQDHQLQKLAKDGHLPAQDFVGGFVKSYKFAYTPKEDIQHGEIWINVTLDISIKIPASFLILREKTDSELVDKIVHETTSLSNISDSVLDAYFATYNSTIKRWIIAYERFDQLFSTAIKSDPKPIPIFFQDPDKRTLTEFWRLKVRSFAETLDLAQRIGVRIGGLSDASNYVLTSSKQIKIFRVGMHMQLQNDLDGLRNLFWTDPFFDGKSSTAWNGIETLLKSNPISQNQIQWKPVVLNHPILLKPSDELRCYEEIFVWQWTLLKNQRKKFANVLHILHPLPYRVTVHYFHGTGNFDKKDIELYNKVHGTCSYHPYLHLAITQFVRNFIRHGDDDLEAEGKLQDHEKVWHIKNLFASFMSTAYFVRQMPEFEWDAILHGQKLLYIR